MGYSDDIPDVVRRLIAESIDSVSELEAILLLREDRERCWTPLEAGQRLYVSTAVANYILTVLGERGFLEKREESWCYAPRSPELAAAVDQLQAAYSRALIAVTKAIHAKPSASVRQFADAFRLRKDE